MHFHILAMLPTFAKRKGSTVVDAFTTCAFSVDAIFSSAATDSKKDHTLAVSRVFRIGARSKTLTGAKKGDNYMWYRGCGRRPVDTILRGFDQIDGQTQPVSFGSGDCEYLGPPRRPNPMGRRDKRYTTSVIVNRQAVNGQLNVTRGRLSRRGGSCALRLPPDVSGRRRYPPGKRPAQPFTVLSLSRRANALLRLRRITDDNPGRNLKVQHRRLLRRQILYAYW